MQSLAITFYDDDFIRDFTPSMVKISIYMLKYLFFLSFFILTDILSSDPNWIRFIFTKRLTKDYISGQNEMWKPSDLPEPSQNRIRNSYLAGPNIITFCHLSHAGLNPDLSLTNPKQTVKQTENEPYVPRPPVSK